MTTRRLFERLRSVPDDASERVVRSVKMRAIGPRLPLGLVVLAVQVARPDVLFRSSRLRSSGS